MNICTRNGTRVCVEKRISPSSGVAGNRHTRLSAAAAAPPALLLLLGAAAAQVVFPLERRGVEGGREGAAGERSTNFLVELISLV